MRSLLEKGLGFPHGKQLFTHAGLLDCVRSGDRLPTLLSRGLHLPYLSVITLVLFCAPFSPVSTIHKPIIVDQSGQLAHLATLERCNRCNGFVTYLLHSGTSR